MSDGEWCKVICELAASGSGKELAASGGVANDGDTIAHMFEAYVFRYKFVIKQLENKKSMDKRAHDTATAFSLPFMHSLPPPNSLPSPPNSPPPSPPLPPFSPPFLLTLVPSSNLNDRNTTLSIKCI